MAANTADLGRLVAQAISETIADAAAQTPKLAETLAGAAGYIDAMLEVVPVQRDVALDVLPAAHDAEALAGMVEAHRLSGPVERYLEARR